MSTEKPLVNRVAESGLITINLEDHYPTTEIVELDLKDYLYKGLMLREREFRGLMEEHNWKQYDGKHLCVFCSSDAIVPTWAYMLVAVHAGPYAASINQTSSEDFLNLHYRMALQGIDPASFTDERIVIKGCSDKPVPPSAYMELTRLLRPYAKSIMYGEPCSTVPLYKKAKATASKK